MPTAVTLKLAAPDVRRRAYITDSECTHVKTLHVLFRVRITDLPLSCAEATCGRGATHCAAPNEAARPPGHGAARRQLQWQVMRPASGACDRPAANACSDGRSNPQQPEPL